MRNLSKFILTKIMGWKVIEPFPEISKCVIVVAPHTSNWDFVVGKLAYNSLGRQANFLIKAEWFFFPFNIIFSRMGGIINWPMSLRNANGCIWALHPKVHANQ